MKKRNKHETQRSKLEMALKQGGSGAAKLLKYDRGRGKNGVVQN